MLRPAYFLVKTFSSEVTISRVTLAEVYFEGPNVPGHLLLTNGTTASSRASHNNFAWDQLTSSQLWFSFDVTVTKIGSSGDTMFKLNNGQRGVYSFTAVVDVEWMLDVGTPSINLPSDNSTSPYEFKKRMVLQGTVSQGSHYAALVEIDNPASSSQPTGTQPDEPVSAGSIIMIPFSAIIGILWLFVHKI